MKSLHMKASIFVILITESLSFSSHRVLETQRFHPHGNKNKQKLSFHSLSSSSLDKYPIPELRLRSSVPIHSKLFDENNRNKYRFQTIRALSRYSDELPESDVKEYNKIDPIVSEASKALRRSSWLSWWIQVILTTVSSVTLLFAKSVLSAQSRYNGGSFSLNRSGFFLAGSGIAFSFLSILWTWGETRLSRRLLRRRDTTRISAASITRRAVTIGTSINLIGMALSLLGAENIIGVLVAKAISFQIATPGSSGVGLNSGNLVAQTLQPLDILIVQANTNTLLSHFCSLFLLLWWGKKWILRLDPASIDED